MRIVMYIGWILAFLGHAALAAPVDMALNDIDGKLQHLSQYRGKWVVVNYWATWCPPCRAEIPELIFFHDAHKDKDAVVVGINAEATTPGHVRTFLEDYMVNYPILLADPDDGSPLGNLTGLPTTFLISPKGEVVYAHTGMVNRKSLEAALAKYRGPTLPPTAGHTHEKPR
ncbi:MAG: TlpA family protein disulfide reductase [Gammaproteobacteria bacterium]|nr:TlpA family protein disulfide reductase [Gammaproteobacteria bacterium]